MGDLEPGRHLTGAVPCGRRHRIAVGRFVVVEPLAQPVQPALHRLDVGDDPVGIGEAHGRDDIMHRVLELGPERGLELRRFEQRPQHLGDVAVGSGECRRHALDQRLRRCVRHEVNRELAGHVMRGGRLTAEDVQGLLDLAEAAALDQVTEEDLVAVVVAVRVELEQALADQLAGVSRPDVGTLRALVDPDTGEDARQLLHVLLGVARADAHGVKLHDFAGVVLVDLPGGVLRIVEILQHGRMAQRRFEQVAELAERARAQRLVLIVADQHPDVGLTDMNVEMVEPETGHLFLKLVGRVEVAQQRTRHRLIAKIAHRLLIGLVGDVLLIRVRGGGEIGLVLGVDGHQQSRGGLLRHGQGVDPRLRLGRQPVLRRGLELMLEPAVRPHSGHRRRVGGIDAPGHAIDQGQVIRVGQRRRGDGRQPDQHNDRARNHSRQPAHRSSPATRPVSATPALNAP